MPYIPYYPVGRRIKAAVERNAQLYRAEIGRKMTAVFRHRVYYVGPQFAAEKLQLRFAHVLELLRHINIVRLHLERPLKIRFRPSAAVTAADICAYADMRYAFRHNRRRSEGADIRVYACGS